ncbi:Asp23/Gls24 family envelope stress response protein [Streptomyces sp. NPDC048664]|uniref:Asp23/Gls24 family envelope stress response protein n=1 Tax=Streptomyces sp. NPDC048664 TaxID=3154505 RepID=UPI003433A06D
MNTGTGPDVATGGDPPAVRALRLPPPAERGATVIPDKVVARIAARAAHTVQSRRAALPPGRDRPAAPSASAATHMGSVRLHLALDLPYPADIPLVCERIRHDVAERVTRLTGLRVGEVTLVVRRLVPLSGVNRGRVR